MRTTIGAEEEFVLLDPGSLTPVPRAAEALRALGGPSDGRGRITAEFFPSQVEFASPVCDSLAELQGALAAFRSDLTAWAAAEGLVAAGVGTPFRVVPGAEVTAQDRYRDIAGHFGRIVGDHQINGLHVHVGVDSRDAAVRGMNRLRPWLPALLALSANSPFWNGEDTGFASWRTIHGRRWTTHGVPPEFADAADYEARVAALTGVGGTSDPGTINWVVRPSERYPTVEVRVFDAQLDVTASVALAALVRGVVTSAPSVDAPAPELLDAAFWHAARDGVGGDLVHPDDGALHGARTVVAALFEVAGPGLVEHGDADRARATVDRILDEGTGAVLQRRALAGGGEPGLAARIDAAASPIGADSAGVHFAP